MSRSVCKWVMGALLTLAALAQIICAALLYNQNGSDLVTNIGWGILWLSAVFGWLPIITFRKWGKVKGKGYIHTTVLVDRGVYAIVRHPQYLAGILACIALSLIAQHWLVCLLGLISIIIYYLNTIEEERDLMEKFGDQYQQYAARVPRLNFILGIVRLMLNRKRNGDT